MTEICAAILTPFTGQSIGFLSSLFLVLFNQPIEFYFRQKTSIVIGNKNNKIEAIKTANSGKKQA